MRSDVHLEGFGWLGCLLGWHLERRGVRWTWNDDFRRVNAHGACTGGVYPSGDRGAENDRREWIMWHIDPPWSIEPGGAGVTEQADWWFCTKLPPHGYREPVLDHALPWRTTHAARSVHVNVPAIVNATRNIFVANQRSECPPEALRVVSHGFNRRVLRRFVWGWSGKTRIRPVSARWPFSGELRPAFYFPESRWNVMYAYPVPGDPQLWFAGSAMIAQDTPRELPTVMKVRKWRRRAAELGLNADMPEEIRHGWRPKGTGSCAPALEGGVLYLPAMGADGIRRAPTIMNEVLRSLECLNVA